MPRKRKATPSPSTESPTNKDKLLFCYFALDPDSKAMHPPAICTQCGSTIRRPHGKNHALLSHLEKRHKFFWEEFLNEALHFKEDTPTEENTDTWKMNVNDAVEVEEDEEEEEEDLFTFVDDYKRRKSCNRKD